MRHTSTLRLMFACAIAGAGATALYACSSKDEPAPVDGTDGSVTNPPPPDPPKPPPTDSGGGGGDSGDNDSGPPPRTCTVNPIVDGGVPREIAQGDFLDGPHWVPSLGLVMSEYNQSRIVRVGPDGGALQQVRVLAQGETVGNSANAKEIVSAAVNPSRILFTPIPDAGADARAPFSPDGGQAPNDLVVSSTGNMYITDPAYQTGGATFTHVFRVAPNGATSVVQRFIAAGPLPLPRPNGIALSPDEKSLYVSITEPKRIVKYPVAADGTTGAGTDFVVAANITMDPDGLAVDVGGNVYVAESAPRGGGNPNRGMIEIFKPDGTKWGSIPVAGERPTGLAFGNDDKTLYITTERSLLVVGVACEGVR